MNGFGKLAFVETKLFLRERVAVAALLGIPVALVVGFGMIPGFGKPDKSLSGQIGTEYIASLGVAIVIVMLGLNGIPAVMGIYREKGILRRLSATPVRPAAVLLAKMLVWLATVLVSVTLVITVSRLAFHVPLPVRLGWFVLSVALGVAALFALGMFVAAVAPTSRAAIGHRLAAVLPQHVPGRRVLPHRADVAHAAGHRGLRAARRRPARGAAKLDGPGPPPALPGHNGGMGRRRGPRGGPVLPLGVRQGRS